MTISKFTKFLQPAASAPISIMAIKPNSFGVKGEYVLNKISSNMPKQSLWKRLIPKVLASDTTGYHGTSMKALGNQLETGEFEDKGKKIYVGTLAEAVHYAAKKSSLDGSRPIVLKVYSDQKAIDNDFSMEGHGVSVGLGAFSYLLAENGKVYIQEAFETQSSDS